MHCVSCWVMFVVGNGSQGRPVGRTSSKAYTGNDVHICYTHTDTCSLGEINSWINKFMVDIRTYVKFF